MSKSNSRPRSSRALRPQYCPGCRRAVSMARTLLQRQRLPLKQEQRRSWQAIDRRTPNHSVLSPPAYPPPLAAGRPESQGSDALPTSVAGESENHRREVGGGFANTAKCVVVMGPQAGRPANIVMHSMTYNNRFARNARLRLNRQAARLPSLLRGGASRPTASRRTWRGCRFPG